MIREHELYYNAPTAGRGARPSARMLKFHVMLTSYQMVLQEQAVLSAIKWAVLVVDEAQRLKNSSSRLYRTLCCFKSDYRILLTGTPLQNSLDELFHLLGFLEPARFASVNDLLARFENFNEKRQIEEIRRILAPRMLRRLKVPRVRRTYGVGATQRSSARLATACPE